MSQNTTPKPMTRREIREWSAYRELLKRIDRRLWKEAANEVNAASPGPAVSTIFPAPWVLKVIADE